MTHAELEDVHARILSELEIRHALFACDPADEARVARLRRRQSLFHNQPGSPRSPHMQIKSIEAFSDRVVTAHVSEEDLVAAETKLDQGHAGVWLRCTNDQGWPFRLNLSNVVTLERAAS